MTNINFNTEKQISQNTGTPNNKFIGIDWLQYGINIKMLDEKLKVYELDHALNGLKTNGYQLKLMPYRAKFFNKVVEIEIEGFEGRVATLEYSPHQNVMPLDYAMLKIDNAELYSDRLKELVTKLFEILPITFVKVLRADVFIDFTQLDNGDSPEEFMEKIVTKKVRERRSRKMTVFTPAGFDQKPTYVRLGSITRRTTTIVYNKSLEMHQKTFKPYIKAGWKEAKLDLEKDVWRVEFSFKNDKSTFVDAYTGEAFKTDQSPHCIFDNFEVIFKGMFQRMMHLKVHEDNVKFRDFKDYNAFFDFVGCYVPMPQINKNVSNKTTKTLLKKLCEIAFNDTTLNKTKSRAILTSIGLIVAKYELWMWFKFQAPTLLGDLHRLVPLI